MEAGNLSPLTWKEMIEKITSNPNFKRGECVAVKKYELTVRIPDDEKELKLKKLVPQIESLLQANGIDYISSFFIDDEYVKKITGILID
jgi:hypothetical protein